MFLFSAGVADDSVEDFAQIKLENQALMQELEQLQEEKRCLQNDLKEKNIWCFIFGARKK